MMRRGVRERTGFRKTRGTLMDADLGYGAEGGAPPEGLPGSGHRGRREGWSVGSLWCRRGPW